jgi:TonB family protein
MKKLIFFSVFLLTSIFAIGQGNYKVVQQQQAHYPVGDVALQEYFNKNIQYSQEALDKRLYGSVMLSYDVNADSTISNIIVLKGMGFGVDEEVVRLITPLKFAPAISNNVAFRSSMITSINIKALPGPKLEIEKP